MKLLSFLEAMIYLQMPIIHPHTPHTGKVPQPPGWQMDISECFPTESAYELQ